jgi:hypothetical protein
MWRTQFFTLLAVTVLINLSLSGPVHTESTLVTVNERAMEQVASESGSSEFRVREPISRLALGSCNR